MRLAFVIALIAPFTGIAQVLNLRGTVKEGSDVLPLAHVIVLPDSITSVTDNQGKFSVVVESGRKQIFISYTGYEILSQEITTAGDTTLYFNMKPAVGQLAEVVVTARKDPRQELFESTRMSTQVLLPEEVTAVPVLGGEADLIKVLQLMPGTVRGIEGSSDLFVRGGAADQNLVLLDGSAIYNTSHLLGFVSVFNPDILESVESVNGGFPAQYGGRLSSILDVKTKSNIARKTSISGDVGLIASRLLIEQPIVQEKVGVWIAGRRTYIDRVMKLINEELPYFFYDFNMKLMVRPTSRDELDINYYQGDDDLNIFRDRNNDGQGFLTSFKAGNSNQSLQWRHRLSNHWQSSVTVTRTEYDYDILNAFRDSRLLANSNIEDSGLKLELTQFGNKKNGAIKVGTEWVNHRISPSVVNSAGAFSEFLGNSSSVGRISNELAIYGQYEWMPAPRWTINHGLRFSGAVVKNESYWTPEPRVSARYAISDTEAFKVSYSRMAQYIHRITNSAVTSPTDIWYPVTDSVRPQTAHQFSVGWQRSFPAQNVSISAEAYYKPMQNLIGLEEGTNLFFNSNFQSSLIQGRGRAYGLEMMIRKTKGKFTGWVSYTLARSTRQFDQINGGSWFPSRYDRRHNGALVGQYSLTPRLSFSLVWEFISGARFTPIIGQYQVLAPSTTGIDLVPVFAPINSVKLADSHRLDLGLKLRSKPGKKFQYEWFAGVYNVYNRANPVAITIEQNESDGSLRYEQPGLIGLLPFISYGFKF